MTLPRISASSRLESWSSRSCNLRQNSMRAATDGVCRLDLRIHTTTQERPIDRFQREVAHLTPLPEQRFVGTLALSRKVSWDCLVSYQGNRYSVPAT